MERHIISILLGVALAASCTKESGSPRRNPVEVEKPKPTVTLFSQTVIAYPDSTGILSELHFRTEPGAGDTSVYLTTDGNVLATVDYDPETGLGTVGLMWRGGDGVGSSTLRVNARNGSGEASAEATVFPPKLSVFTEGLLLEAGESSGQVAFRSNVPVRVTVKDDCQWLSVTDLTDESVTVTAAKNRLKTVRVTKVFLSDTTGFLSVAVPVAQAGTSSETPEPGPGPDPSDPDDPGTDPPVMEYVRNTQLVLLTADGKSVTGQRFTTGEIYYVQPSFLGSGTPQSYAVSAQENDVVNAVGDSRLHFHGSGHATVRVEAVMSGTLTYYNELDVYAVCPVYTGLVCWYLNENGAKEWSNTGIYFQVSTDLQTKVTLTGKVTAKSLFGSWTSDITGVSGKSVEGKGEFLVLKYTDLEGFVKKHLAASFSVEITISSPTKDRDLYFVPTDSMKRLLDSTGKDIPVKINGKTIDWKSTIKL